MKNTVRAFRRHLFAKIKWRMAKMGKQVYHLDEAEITPKWVAHMAETHGKPCSCPLCGHHRRYQGPRPSEKRHLVEDPVATVAD
jgi:hypothetical protein